MVISCSVTLLRLVTNSLLWVCLISSVFIFTAHAQKTVTSRAETHELDVVATANAPWKVGEIIPNTQQTIYTGRTYSVYRRFLGMTIRGCYLVQNFYKEHEQKRTAPYILIHREDVDGEGKPLYRGDLKIDGPYISWYPNGQKRWEGFYVDGKKEGLGISWNELGNKWSKRYFKNDLREGLWTRWYSNRSIISE